MVSWLVKSIAKCIAAWVHSEGCIDCNCWQLETHRNSNAHYSHMLMCSVAIAAIQILNVKANWNSSWKSMIEVWYSVLLHTIIMVLNTVRIVILYNWICTGAWLLYECYITKSGPVDVKLFSSDVRMFGWFHCKWTS